MRRLLAALPLFLWIVFSAGEIQAQTHVYETAQGTGTVRNVFVTNSNTVRIDSSSRTLTGRFTAEIFNDDATNALFCAFDATVSSTTAVNDRHYGRRIVPRTAWTVSIGDQMQIHCTADAASGARAVLTQLK